MSKKIFLAMSLVVGSAIVFLFILKGCPEKTTLVEPSEQEMLSPNPIVVEDVPVVSTAVTTVSTPVAVEKKPVKKLPVVSGPVVPPPIVIYKELIPKNVEIVRVYYTQSLMAPGSTVEFDINGSGFNLEFEKMIKVESGHDDVSVNNLELLTPNQIHGVLIVSPKAVTKICYPRVLIQDKVVFQAPDPFAVIREGDVLNVIFTEMGESGRTGRFRVFTNLTPEMFNDFRVQASTPSIQISNFKPQLPFLVDGDIVIGPATGGDYGLSVFLKDKTLWARDGIIRVVRPNVGQSGLVQRLQTLDGFYRPGDAVKCLLQGSGFRSEDANLLAARVPGLEIAKSTFVYLAPGRMELSLEIPANAATGSYGITILQGQDVLLETPNSFSVVDKNWLRGFRLDPELKPGGKGSVVLIGRDLEKSFIDKIKAETDDPQLSVGIFEWVGSTEARASIEAGSSVKPGDYLIHLTIDGKAQNPQFGSLIRISK